jgi:hypothetical protein
MRGYLAKYTIYVYKLGTTIERKAGRSGCGLRGVTSAGENGEARIFWEGWIGLGELAEEELRAFA